MKEAKNNNLILMIILALVMAGGGFFAGMKYQQSKQPSRTGFLQGRSGVGQEINRRAIPEGMPEGMPGEQSRSGVGMIRGEIISQDEESIIVKLMDNSSKMVLLSGDTKITKSFEGTTDDLETGQQVMVSGDENSDGSLSAQTIQLNPVDGGL